MYRIFLETRIIGLHLHFAAGRSVYLRWNFSRGLRKILISARGRFGSSTSSKVIPTILHRFRDIEGFCAHDPILIPP